MKKLLTGLVFLIIFFNSNLTFADNNIQLQGLTLSEWKLLETKLERRDRSLLYPSLYFLGMYGTIAGCAFIFYEPEELNWDRVEFDNFIKGITFRSYRWDGDRFWFNYIAHPINGSEFYLRARMRGFSPMESFLFSVVTSAVWEMLFEAWVEPVSVQDMVITPTAGSLIGELRFQGKLWLKKQHTAAGDIGAFLIDPIQGTVEAIYGLFSKDVQKELPDVTVTLFFDWNGRRITF